MSKRLAAPARRAPRGARRHPRPSRPSGPQGRTATAPETRAARSSAEQPPRPDDENDRHQQEDEDQRDFGQDRRPKALSRETRIAATKAPIRRRAPDHHDDEDLDDDAQVHRMVDRLARHLQRAAEPARSAPSAKTPVNSHFWLTPSAATMSRSCVAARTSTPQRVRWNSSHRSPSTSGTEGDRKVVGGRACPAATTAPDNPGARGARGLPVPRSGGRDPARRASRRRSRAIAGVRARGRCGGAADLEGGAEETRSRAPARPEPKAERAAKRSVS